MQQKLIAYDTPIGFSETAHGEDTVETNDPGDGKGLLHHVRVDRIASSRSHHLARREQYVS